MINLKKSPAKIGADRLKKVLISDKHFNPERVKNVIKSDIYSLLINYADISSETLDLKIEINENGGYNISVNAKANRLKVLGNISS